MLTRLAFQLGYTPLQSAYGAHQIRQAGEACRCTQPIAGIESRRAADNRTFGNIVAYARLRPDNRILSDREVTGRTGLSRHDDVFFENGTAGEARLTADDIVLTHNASVSNLAKAVDLGA